MDIQKRMMEIVMDMEITDIKIVLSNPLVEIIHGLSRYFHYTLDKETKIWSAHRNGYVTYLRNLHRKGSVLRNFSL